MSSETQEELQLDQSVIDDEDETDIHEESKEDKPFEFTPDIKLEPVNNGVIYLQITNCDTMWEKNQYQTMHDVCFEFVYRKIITNKHDTNPDIDQVWRRRSILVGNTGYDGTIYIKVPIYLIDYSIEFFIHCRNSKTNEFMAPSPVQCINIPSFLLNNNYKIDDVIHFRDEHTFYTSQGKIVEILDDNKFKIFYYKYNETQDDEENEENIENIENTIKDREWIPTHEIIHISRIYHKGTEMQYELDLIDSDEMETNLLIKRNDIESKEIYNTLIDIYNKYSFIWCLEKYGDEKGLIHWNAVSCFVSKNIFDFLFKSEFEYKVDCLLNGDEHCLLRLNNLRESDIRTKYELQQNKIGNIDIEIDEFDELSYRCDSCRTGLRDWNFVYQCSTNPLNRHDFCLNCVNTVIILNKELHLYLNHILHENLNKDCIQVIICYVIGRVICV